MNAKENWHIIGHNWVVNLLQKHVANERIRHAYLFTGPTGIGRRTLAIRLSQAINCKQSANPGFPCLECQTCKRIEKGEHPDLSIVQADQDGGMIKVNQIRELQHSLALTPYDAKFRTALLLRFEEANPNASNALLKTLEEPQAKVVMMLTAQDSESLLPTIVSRCEVIRLRTLSMETIIDGLEAQYEISTEQAKLYAHISGGRPGFAIKIHEDPAIMESRQSWVKDLLGLLSSTRVERFNYVEMIAKEKFNLDNLIEVWTSIWRDVYLLISGSSTNITNIDWGNEIEVLARKINFSKSVGMVNSLQKTRLLLKKNINPRLIMEVFMLELPYLQNNVIAVEPNITNE